jgi:hypothetical protein
MSRIGTKRTKRAGLTMSVVGGIVLQNSQNAGRLISRGKTKQATIADQCSLKPLTGIACEFGARRRSPPHNYSIVAPTARRIRVPCRKKTFATLSGEDRKSSAYVQTDAIDPKLTLIGGCPTATVAAEAVGSFKITVARLPLGSEFSDITAYGADSVRRCAATDNLSLPCREAASPIRIP